MFLKIFHRKGPVLESLFNKAAVTQGLFFEMSFFMNSFFYRTPPVVASVVFAAKQCIIQCHNDNFGL